MLICKSEPEVPPGNDGVPASIRCHEGKPWMDLLDDFAWKDEVLKVVKPEDMIYNISWNNGRLQIKMTHDFLKKMMPSFTSDTEGIKIVIVL